MNQLPARHCIVAHIPRYCVIIHKLHLRCGHGSRHAGKHEPDLSVGRHSQVRCISAVSAVRIAASSLIIRITCGCVSFCIKIHNLCTYTACGKNRDAVCSCGSFCFCLFHFFLHSFLGIFLSHCAVCLTDLIDASIFLACCNFFKTLTVLILKS